MNRILSVVLSLTLLAAPALVSAESSSDEWVDLASTGTDTFSIKKSSFDISTNKNNEPIAVIVGQDRDLKNKKVSYSKWYVSGSDCEQGFGKLVHLDLDGTYKLETDYAHAGTSVSSSIGTFLCDVYLEIKQKNAQKGI